MSLVFPSVGTQGSWKVSKTRRSDFCWRRQNSSQCESVIHGKGLMDCPVEFCEVMGPTSPGQVCLKRLFSFEGVPGGPEPLNPHNRRDKDQPRGLRTPLPLYLNFFQIAPCGAPRRRRGRTEQFKKGLLVWFITCTRLPISVCVCFFFWWSSIEIE